MKKIAVLLCSILLSMSWAHAKGDASKGKAVYDDKKINCQLCHGKKGLGKAKIKKDGTYKVGPMSGPCIAGLSKDYVHAQLVAVHEGKRKKGKWNIMQKHLKKKYKGKKLTDDDFWHLASYVASMERKGKKCTKEAKGMLE